MEETTVVGKSLPRIDGLEKVTGTAKYTDDLDFPGLLHAKVLRSPHAHAKILRIDTSEAEKLPGVRAVITHKDVPKVAYNSSWRGPFHFGILAADEYVLDNEVRFIGDKVAAVAADDPQIAEEALKLIRVDYQPLPAVFDAIEAMKPDAPLVHPEQPEPVKGNITRHATLGTGDVEKGFSEADYVFEGKYTTQRQAHCCLETHGSVASFDAARNKLTVFTPNQVPFCLRFLLSTILGMPESRIRVKVPPLGGGFGSKDETFEEPILAILSKITGRPVKIRYSREEEMIFTRTRHASISHIKSGFKKDGTLTFRYIKVIMDTGPYATGGPQVLFAGGSRWVTLYRSPNILFDGYLIYTNNNVAGAYRGFGNAQINFATECHMDEVAEKMGIDPLELRLKNVINSGDVNPATGYTIESCGMRECIALGAERVGWSDRKDLSKVARGIGMGVNTHVSGARPYIPEISSATIKINDDGTVVLLVGVSDLGTGVETVLAQIAAEGLGVRLEDISVVLGDTDATPFDYGAYASRTTYMAGNAVLKVAREAKALLLKHAAKMLEASTDLLEIKDSVVFVNENPDKKLKVSEVAMALHYSKVGPQTIVISSMVDPATNSPTFSAQFAEVQVDTETGRVKVLRIVSAHDLGRAINPKAVDAQVEGAVLMGLGLATTEDFLVRDGRVLNPNLKDYKLPTPLDMPRVETILVESNEPKGPFGAKGVGESALVSIAPAIANAIYNAVGVRIHDLPITPEKVLKALKQKGEKGA